MPEQSGLRTISQTFEFPGATLDGLAQVLATAPLTGPASIFGKRKTQSVSSAENVRKITGFEPVPLPLLRFDLEIRQRQIATGVIMKPMETKLTP